MSDTSPLALAFIDRRPDSAARVLASIPSDDAAVFLAQLPTGSSVPLLARLSPGLAAQILEAVDVTVAMVILKEMDFAPAAAILRQFPDSKRKTLLADLPQSQRRRLASSISFAPNTVGAHMSTAIDVLAAHCTVQDALELKRAQRQNASDLVFVIDDKRTLIGTVTALTLIRHSSAAVLADIVAPNCASVSPQLRLAELGRRVAWQNLSQLPVVSRRGELLGAISRASPESTITDTVDGLAASTASLGGSALDVLGHGAAGLLGLLLPADKSESTREGTQHGD